MRLAVARGKHASVPAEDALASCKTLEKVPCDVTSLSLSLRWALGEREGYGEPCDVTSLSLSLKQYRD